MKIEAKEYVATFKSSIQISPDDFKVINPSMKVTGTTTIGEICDFFKKHNEHVSVEFKVIQLS